MPVPTPSGCRSFASCGSRKACRSRCSAAGCSPTTRSTWAMRRSPRSRSAGRTRWPALSRTPPAGRPLRLPARGGGGRTAVRPRDSVETGPAGHIAGRSPIPTWRCCSISTIRAGSRLAASTTASSSRSNGCSSIPISCCGCSATRSICRRRRLPTRSTTWISRRGCRSSSGAAFPTTSSWPWPNRARCRTRWSSSSRPGGCSTIRAPPRRWWTTSPPNG